MEFAITSVLILSGFLLTLTFHVIEPDELAVVTRWGRPHRFAGRGLLVIIPLVERVERVPREHLLDAAQAAWPAPASDVQPRPAARK